jgi:hypothetical protein
MSEYSPATVASLLQAHAGYAAASLDEWTRKVCVSYKTGGAEGCGGSRVNSWRKSSLPRVRRSRHHDRPGHDERVVGEGHEVAAVCADTDVAVGRPHRLGRHDR